MVKKREMNLDELYADDPERADAIVFGRISDKVTRRGFVSGLATMSALVGGEIVFSKFLPQGMMPVAYGAKSFTIPGKDKGLTILNDRPVNAEVPPHLLNDKITPNNRMFVRNNGIPPKNTSASSWKITFAGEALKAPVTMGLRDIQKKFPKVTRQIWVECGGNGRAFYNPPAGGNQWTYGAVGCPVWTGVRLRDVLDSLNINYQDVVSVGYKGADTHISGQKGKDAISRAMLLEKAMDDNTLIAWEMNGDDIPEMNGAPVRLVTPGVPGSFSGKWLSEVLVRNIMHDGTKMRGSGYRMPYYPVAPGTKVDKKHMTLLQEMPVKSLITSFKSGDKHSINKTLNVAGHAWTGEQNITGVDVSIDFGQTWHKAALTEAANPFAWQHFGAQVNFPRRGYYEVWARATDNTGKMQPPSTPGWNPKGYANNMIHRIAVNVV